MPGLIDAHVNALAASANLALLDAMPGTYLGAFGRRFHETSLDVGLFDRQGEALDVIMKGGAIRKLRSAAS